MHEIKDEQESSAKSIVKGMRESPILIVFCGPSHVGKTTFARRLSELGENFTIISPDEIRKRLSISFRDSKYETEVWDTYESMKCQALKEGRNVILDACHISERARWHALQGPNTRHRKICVVFDLPFRTIRERCLKEKRVSLKEVERMWKDFQNSKPTIAELKLQGFDEIYFIAECPACAARLAWRGWSAGLSISGASSPNPIRKDYTASSRMAFQQGLNSNRRWSNDLCNRCPTKIPR